MKVTFLKSCSNLEQLPVGKVPHIAMVGRSNVGKSSLLNHIAGQKGLAHVSAEPGRTKLINLFDVDKRLYLVDLPGYGYAKTSKANRDAFADLIRDYIWKTQQLKLVFLIIDIRIGATDLDRDMLAYLESGKIPTVIIANKIDKLSKSEASSALTKVESEYPRTAVIAHSNINGQGRGEIWDAMEKILRQA